MNLNQLPPPSVGIFRRKCGIALMVSLLFAGMINPSKAQDEYGLVTWKKGTFSIVRQLTSTKRVAYNRCPDDDQTYGWNAFFMYDDATTPALTPTCMALPINLYVNDIFVRGIDVYFCGKRVLSNSQEEAVLGMFSTTGFPSTQLYIFTPSGFSEFGMMIGYDMFENGSLSVPHIMMTAKRTNGEWTLVEGSTPSVGNVTWEYDKMSAPVNWGLSGHVFQDMATTKDYILVTSSVQNGPSVGTVGSTYSQYVWCLPKPSNRQISTPFSSVERMTYSTGAHDAALLVSGCGDNKYVLASDASPFQIYFDLCDGYQLIKRSYRQKTTTTVGNATEIKTFKLRDMKWNDHSQEMDVFVLDPKEYLPHFWHLPLSLLASRANGYADEHVYNKYNPSGDCSFFRNCNTFDYINGTDFFIFSGHDTFAAFRYKYNSWGDYFDQATFQVRKKNNVDPFEYKALIIKKISASCESDIIPTTEVNN